MSEYPEHDKLMELEGKNDTVGEFLEWLMAEGYEIGKWRHWDSPWAGISGDKFEPVGAKHHDLLASFFNIDRDRLAAEKDEMLRSIRGES